MMIFLIETKNSRTLEKHTIEKKTTQDSKGITFNLYLGLTVKYVDRPIFARGKIT